MYTYIYIYSLQIDRGLRTGRRKRSAARHILENNTLKRMSKNF